MQFQLTFRRNDTKEIESVRKILQESGYITTDPFYVVQMDRTFVICGKEEDWNFNLEWYSPTDIENSIKQIQSRLDEALTKR